MAVFKNNKNVVSYCFAANDEIKLLKIFSSPEKSEEYYTLKCPLSEKSGVSKGSKPKLVKENSILSVAVSNDGNSVSASDSNNLLYFWKYDKNSWNTLSARSLVRKCQKIIFTNSGSDVILADRSGDVYVFSVSDDDKKGKFLLGHISLIIDIAICSDDRYLLTSDRDGKVRVSYYPNCYNIHSYCLGHQEFVSSVQCVMLHKELIFTTSGDGSIKLWDFAGNNISGVNLYENKVLLDKLETFGVKGDSEESNGTPNTLPYLLNDKQVAFAVKRVCFSPISKIGAVLFYSVKVIAIYCIPSSENCYFEFIEFIPLNSVPLDAFFDVEDNLVILEKTFENQCLFFKLVNGDKKYFKALDQDSVLISEKLQKLNFNISDLNDGHDDFESYFKRHFDDKEDVIETKQDPVKKIKNC